MGETAKILIIDDDARAREVLSDALEGLESFKGLCALCGSEDGDIADFPEKDRVLVGDVGAIEAHFQLSKPVRLGRVLDCVSVLSKKQIRREAKRDIELGPWVLDSMHSVLKAKVGKHQDEEIRLTEKETEILVVLHENTNQSVSRDTLLKAVWGYVDGVETHTLETHIYRLRQKIEENPASPVFLLTTDDGYRFQDC